MVLNYQLCLGLCSCRERFSCIFLSTSTRPGSQQHLEHCVPLHTLASFPEIFWDLPPSLALFSQTQLASFAPAQHTPSWRHRPHWMVVGEGPLKLQTFLSLSVPSAEDASEAPSEWRKNGTGKDTPCLIRSLENRIPLSIQLSLEKFFFFFSPGAASLFLWDGLLSKITLRRSAILPILLAVKCSSAACVSPAGVPCRRDCCQPGNQRTLAGRAEPHQRNSRPSYFFFFLSKQGPVFVDGLQAQKKKITHCFTVTWSAGLCPLFRFCFTCVFPWRQVRMHARKVLP